MAALMGLEPTAFRLTTGCSNQLSYSAIVWYRRWESNPTRPFGHRNLNPARLPFRHSGIFGGAPG